MAEFLFLGLLVFGGIYVGNTARGTISRQRSELALLRSELAQAKSDLAQAQRKLAQAKKLAKHIQSL